VHEGNGKTLAQWALTTAVRHSLRSAARRAIGVVYPPTCVGCGGATGEAHTLCAACWSEVRFIERPFCERLGTPFAVDLGIALLSPAAIADPPVFQRARAVARYDEIARALVHRLKYGDRLELAPAVGWPPPARS
jgi:predicted amidophosphoribosyltransferase